MPDPQPDPGRRAYDQSGGAMVVPLKDYLEDKITSHHEKVTAEISHLRAEIATAQAQASSEHAEVKTKIGELTAAVDGLQRNDNAQRVSFSLLAKVSAGLVTLITVATGVAALILQAV